MQKKITIGKLSLRKEIDVFLQMWKHVHPATHYSLSPISLISKENQWSRRRSELHRGGGGGGEAGDNDRAVDERRRKEGGGGGGGGKEEEIGTVTGNFGIPCSLFWRQQLLNISTYMNIFIVWYRKGKGENVLTTPFAS